MKPKGGATDERKEKSGVGVELRNENLLPLAGVGRRRVSSHDHTRVL